MSSSFFSLCTECFFELLLSTIVFNYCFQLSCLFQLLIVYLYHFFNCWCFSTINIVFSTSVSSYYSSRPGVRGHKGIHKIPPPPSPLQYALYTFNTRTGLSLTTAPQRNKHTNTHAFASHRGIVAHDLVQVVRVQIVHPELQRSQGQTVQLPPTPQGVHHEAHHEGQVGQERG